MILKSQFKNLSTTLGIPAAVTLILASAVIGNAIQEKSDLLARRPTKISNLSHSTLSHSAPAAATKHDLGQQSGITSKSYLEIIRGLEDGLTSSEDIRNEMKSIAGETPPIEWSTAAIDGVYSLSQVVTHFRNVDDGMELLSTYTLFGPGSAEDTINQFTQKVNEADLQTLKASIVLADRIESRKDQNTILVGLKKQYHVHASSPSLANNFRLREPETQNEFTTPQANAIDPFQLLTMPQAPFAEVNANIFEVEIDGDLQLVSVFPRITELETLTLEVRVLKPSANVITTFILVYE